MPEPTAFETRLADAFERYVAPAPVAVDARALAHEISTTTRRRPTLVGRWTSALDAGAPVPWPRLLLIGLLLAAVVGATLVAASLLLQRPPKLYGEFEPTAELPAVTGDLGSRSANAAATLADGRVLVMGGYNAYYDAPEAWAFVYDPAAGTYTPTGSLPAFRSLSTATTLTDGRVLVAGGYYDPPDGGPPVVPAQGALFDPSTGRFESTMGALSTPRYGHTATLLDDGRVLIVGGFDFSSLLDSAEVFDPASGTFSAVGRLAVARGYHAAVRLPDGRVLVTGGAIDGDSATATTEVFDPATGTFTLAGPMTAPRFWHSMTTLTDGTVLVVGGQATSDASGDPGILASAEIYDPGADRFTATASLLTERSGHSATLLRDGRVLVAGGTNADGEPRTAELYDPRSERFERAGSSTEGRFASWLLPLSDDRVLFVGNTLSGVRSDVWTALRNGVAAPAAAIAPSQGFAAFVTTVGQREGHSTTRLADGRLLIAGGRDPRGAEETSWSAIILDPRTGATTQVGDMHAGRVGHAAVLLPDGRVLMAGGDTGSCPPVSAQCPTRWWTVEVYDPASGTFATTPIRLERRSHYLSPEQAVVLADGRVLFVDGVFVAIIDPVAGQASAGASAGVFDPGASLRCKRVGTPIRLADGRVFIPCTGGVAGAIFAADGSSVETVAGAQGWDDAAPLPDGLVLVVASDGRAGVFDPATTTFERVGQLGAWDHLPISARPRLTPLEDGRVLITGGITPGGDGPVLRGAELFDPRDRTFTVVGPMLAARTMHTATLLEDGRVLLLGGTRRSPDRTDPEPVDAEVFDPEAAR